MPNKDRPLIDRRLLLSCLGQVFGAAVATGFIDIKAHRCADVGVPQGALNQLWVVSQRVSVSGVGVPQLVWPRLDADSVASTSHQLPKALAGHVA